MPEHKFIGDYRVTPRPIVFSDGRIRVKLKHTETQERKEIVFASVEKYNAAVRRVFVPSIKNRHED